MRYQGKISCWKDDKGFGFITPNGGGNQVFVHVRSFVNRKRRPVGNELVTYRLKADNDGRAQAQKVVFTGERVPSAISTGRRHVFLVLAAAFLASVAALVIIGRLPYVVLWHYLALSVVAFLAYAADKSAARNDRWRTQESTLHFFALVGGWPGALAAQKVLRHKSRKRSFQVAFWLTVVLNGSALGWILTPPGSEMLHILVVAASQITEKTPKASSPTGNRQWR